MLFKLPSDYASYDDGDRDAELVELYAREITANSIIDEGIAYGIALDSFLADPVTFRIQAASIKPQKKYTAVDAEVDMLVAPSDVQEVEVVIAAEKEEPAPMEVDESVAASVEIESVMAAKSPMVTAKSPYARSARKSSSKKAAKAEEEMQQAEAEEAPESEVVVVEEPKEEVVVMTVAADSAVDIVKSPAAPKSVAKSAKKSTGGKKSPFVAKEAEYEAGEELVVAEMTAQQETFVAEMESAAAPMEEETAPVVAEVEPEAVVVATMKSPAQPRSSVKSAKKSSAKKASTKKSCAMKVPKAQEEEEEEEKEVQQQQAASVETLQEASSEAEEAVEQQLQATVAAPQKEVVATAEAHVVAPASLAPASVVVAKSGEKSTSSLKTICLLLRK